MTAHDGPAVPPATLETTRASATAFGLALDAGDLASVAALLAPECVCAEGGVETHGAEAVLVLLRAAVRWAERGFDDVRPLSTIATLSPGSAHLAVTVLWMRVPGRWHRLRFERRLEFRADGRVVRLANACDRAAARAFQEFAKESGAAPVPPGFGITGED